MEAYIPACPECKQITDKISQLRTTTLSPSYTKINETLTEIQQLIQKTQPDESTPNFYSFENKILIITTFQLRSNNLGRTQIKLGIAYSEGNPANRILKIDPQIASDRIGAALAASSLALSTAQELGVLSPWLTSAVDSNNNGSAY